MAPQSLKARGALDAYLRHPPENSAARRAMEFGIDLSLTFRNMFGRTMAERLREIDERQSRAPVRGGARQPRPIPV